MERDPSSISGFNDHPLPCFVLDNAPGDGVGWIHDFMEDMQEIPKGYCANGGKSRYLLEADSTTGFTAWRLADGTTLVSPARQVSLRQSDHVEFWACAGYQDTTPAGEIVAFDCHGNDLTELDVTRLKGLKYLDCSYNLLKRLDLTGLTELQALEIEHNRISSLEVKHLKNLRVLNCEGNRLKGMDTSG